MRGLGSIPGLGRFPGERNGNPVQYSCLENPMDRGAWCSIGSKAYLIYKELLFPNDEHPATDSGHQHNTVMSPLMQQRGW